MHNNFKAHATMLIIQISLVKILVWRNKCIWVKFLGINAGYNAINAYNSNFGHWLCCNRCKFRISLVAAGQGATDANSSNFFGNNAGAYATGAARSNFFGLNSGYEARNANSQILGSAGYSATSASNSNSWVKMLVFKRQTLVIQH
jgi:hypothetical protein